jgi:hypothetical protein
VDEARGGCPASNIRRCNFENLIAWTSWGIAPVENRYIRDGIRAVNEHQQRC